METGESPISEVQLTRRHLTDLLDKRRAGSTPERRVVTVLEFLMTTGPRADIIDPEGKKPPLTDPLDELAPFFRRGDDLGRWYHDNAALIRSIRHEDPSNKHTAHYDLSQRLLGTEQSSWLHNSRVAIDLNPFSQDLREAEMAMKLLYVDAMDTYAQYLEDVAREEARQNPPHDSPAA